MLRGDHIPGSGQVHEHRTQVRKSCCGADIQPVGDGGSVAKRTNPEAVAYAVPNVVRRHGDEEHPWQGAPGVFEAADPHEEAEGEADYGD